MQRQSQLYLEQRLVTSINRDVEKIMRKAVGCDLIEIMAEYMKPVVESSVLAEELVPESSGKALMKDVGDDEEIVDLDYERSMRFLQEDDENIVLEIDNRD